MQPTNSPVTDRLKGLLEVAWLCVQIVAVVVAGLWAYSVWGVKDAEELRPRVSTAISSTGARWFTAAKDACLLFGLWSLTNHGNTPIAVEGISGELLSVESDWVPPGSGQLKDYSLGTLLRRAVGRGKMGLQPERDQVHAQGKISRDISIAFRPSDEDMRAWFDRNRLMLRVTATARNLWTKDSTATIEDLSPLSYACSDRNPSLTPTPPLPPSAEKRGG